MAWSQEKVSDIYREMQRVCMEMKGRDQFFEIMDLADGDEDSRLKAICLIITSLRYAEWIREYAPKQIRELETAGMTLLKLCGITPRKSSFDFLYFELLLRVAKWYTTNGYFQKAEAKLQGILLISKYASDELRLELDELNSEIFLRYGSPVLLESLLKKYELFPAKWLPILLISNNEPRFRTEVSRLPSSQKEWWTSYSLFYAGDVELAIKKCADLEKSALNALKIKFWTYAVPSKKWLGTSMPKEANTNNDFEFGEDSSIALKVIQYLGKLYDFDIPLPVRIEQCDKIIQIMPRLPDLESELLTLASLARFAYRSKQQPLLSRILPAYNSVSLRVSNGNSKDVLGIVTDIYKAFSLKESSGTANTLSEAPPVSLMSRRMKQASILSIGASAWVRSVAAGLFLSGEKSKIIKMHLLQEFIEKMTIRLDQLKGVSLKFGQIMSFMFPYLPEEAQKQLAELNNAATPIPEDIVKSLITKELNAELGDVFMQWNSKAFAAASIGQVHLGRLLNGDRVATKIQYPDIRSTIEMDVSSIRHVAPLLNMLFPKIDFEAITKEVKLKFEEECDYRQEVVNQLKFQQIFEGEQDILIPKVYSEYSNERLICSEYMQGLTFVEMLETSDQKEKNQYGKLLFRFFVRSLFRNGLCYGDFNPGNFAFLDGKLVVMDFGLIKEIEPDILQLIRDVFRSAAENDVESFVKIIEQFGFARKSDGKYDYLKHFELFSETTAQPWIHSVEFTYDEEFFRKEVEGNIIVNPIGRNVSIPDNFFLLMRAYIGIVSLLCKMNATQNWAALFWQESES